MVHHCSANLIQQALAGKGVKPLVASSKIDSSSQGRETARNQQELLFSLRQTDVAPANQILSAMEASISLAWFSSVCP